MARTAASISPPRRSASLRAPAEPGLSKKLAKYRSKRDFAATSEPTGKAAKKSSAGNSFVIHKHAARRLHYDFRLEHDGVLWSWSVPKGPSLSPAEKRLAVRTEDHPLDYADFEGVIPKGQYGGGTVVVWDRGTWTPEDRDGRGGKGGGDAREQMKRGRLTFTLDGEKLHGRWHLIRTRRDSKTENWLLFKSRDDAADEEADIVETRPQSVISGRTVEQIAAAPDRVWSSSPEAEPTVAHERAARIARAARSRRAPKHEPAHTSEELRALVAQLPLGFPLTNLDKVLYPEQGITKGQLVAYLAVVAEHMLPHVAGRPLTLVRCPEGRKQPCFFQKHVLAGSPPAIERLPIREVEDGEVAPYMKIRDMAGLVALAQLGTLEIHTWGARGDNPEKPDVMVFDLDPDVGLPWDKVALAAFDLRRHLKELGLESFVKTTGGKGLHVVTPFARRMGWDELKSFSKAVVDVMAREQPKLYTTNMGKSHRKGKIFLDYLRNGRGATFVAPYSPRAREGAPVAVPITWEELAAGVDPKAFDMFSVPRRLVALRADPWKGYTAATRQTITAAMWKALGGKR